MTENSEVIEMKTSINAMPANWTPEIKAKWANKVEPLIADDESIHVANYHTPRPYVDEYNRGTDKAGFVYTVLPGYKVCTVEWQEKAPRCPECPSRNVIDMDNGGEWRCDECETRFTPATVTTGQTTRQPRGRPIT